MTSAEERAPAAPVEWVVQRMRTLGAELPPGDGVAVFNRMYLTVTEEVLRRLAAGRFTNGTAAGVLGARFAARYLDAVDAAAVGGRVPACWRPLFAARHHPGLRDVQFALSGLNAHIGHDLPLALMDTCRALGLRPAALEADFGRMGELLAGLEERIREELMPGPDLLESIGPLTHLVGCWSLGRARDGAWVAFRALWGLREFTELTEEFAERLGAGVGMASRCLLTPLPD